MDKLEAMNAFVKVVALGSYAEAGRVLGLTRSAVSKAVMELEQLLDARLLDRTTRRVGPTEAGLAYYERCLEIIGRVEETEMEVSRLHTEPRGVLRVNARHVVRGALSRSSGRRFHASLSRPQNRADAQRPLYRSHRRRGGCHHSDRESCRFQPHRAQAGTRAPGACRCAILLARHGEPSHWEELALARCLNYGHTTTLQRWQLTQNGETIAVPINSALCSNNGDVLRAAALAGCGITKLPTFLIGPDIKAGRLRIVLAEYPPTELGIYALYTPNRYLAAKTRIFIDFLTRSFGGEPEWDGFRLDQGRLGEPD